MLPLIQHNFMMYDDIQIQRLRPVSADSGQLLHHVGSERNHHDIASDLHEKIQLTMN